jgi:hypothetical protein
MPRLSDRIENALNEARMLLLGGQVLLGFTYRIFFEPVFERLEHRVQLSLLVAVSLTTLSLAALIWPAAFDRIAEHGWQTQRIHSFVTTVLDWALLPFCVGLALSFYPVAVALRAPHPAMIATSMGLFAAACWFGVLLLRHDKEKRRNLRAELQKEEREQREDISERIKKVLIECRMALPGAQAFLGFQFAIVFTDSFERLKRSSQWIHFVSLICMTIAIVLLVAPAAYHRLVEAGEDTEHFHSVASRLLIISIVFLAPGMAGDLYVVMQKVTGSEATSAWSGAALLLFCYGAWFGVSLLARRKSRVDSQ